MGSENRSQDGRITVDIEFHDLSYSIPQGIKGEKRILNNISGQFKSGQLHAIMGPSGAGKSTLLNVLAAYKLAGMTGNVLVNGEVRDVRTFRKISRYIMQEDCLQPLLSIEEIMMLAADLKMSQETTKEQKESAINEILTLLRLTNARHTFTNKLSGGERKRLSIALELINNPPVIFLDEPTTGLDDFCCIECVKLLKNLSESGRTVICSIHTPSAKMFGIFDNVYVMAEGYCVYQGYGPDVVPFLANIGLPCPKSFNPADFIIEVSSGDHGDHLEVLVNEVDNGRSINYYKPGVTEDKIEVKCPAISEQKILRPYNETTKSFEETDRTSSYTQFKILLFRMWIQMYRDKSYLLLRFVLTILIALIVGNMYIGMGQDASKIFFNFGFYFTCIIKFMYIPMMPVLLSFPSEIRTLKHEAFNKWYRLTPYFCALTISTIPITLILGALYVAMVYLMTDQPLEIDRFCKFYVICMLTAMVSESYGLLISSNLSIVNAIFMGPVTAVPLMLLAVYGMGYTYEVPIPLIIQIMMQFSFLRYSFEGLMVTMAENRPSLYCPPTEDFCVFRKLDEFADFMGLRYMEYWVDFGALVGMFVLFRFSCFFLIKQRLRPNKTFRTLKYLMTNLKSNFNIPSY